MEPPSTGSGEAAFRAVRKSELSRFLKQAQCALGLRGEVTLLLADDPRIRELNRSFRGKNKTTDVLSFPAPSNGEGVIGDLAISVPVAAAQAEAHGHELAEELRILALHGLLHLAGFDHETDAGEMRAREAELRRQFTLPVSLIERTLTAGAASTKPAGKTSSKSTRGAQANPTAGVQGNQKKPTALEITKAAAKPPAQKRSQLAEKSLSGKNVVAASTASPKIGVKPLASRPASVKVGSAPLLGQKPDRAKHRKTAKARA